LAHKIRGKKGSKSMGNLNPDEGEGQGLIGKFTMNFGFGKKRNSAAEGEENQAPGEFQEPKEGDEQKS